ncbi:MAG: hypothetical protein AAFZ15_29695 [Bacteroidota bacterium]
MTKNYVFYFCLSLTILTSACQGNTEESTESATKTEENSSTAISTFYLINTNFKMDLPVGYKESSRYFAENDLKGFFKDRLSLKQFQDLLEAMEFTDSGAGIYADTTNNFNHIIIFESDLVKLDKEIGSMFNGRLNEEYGRFTKANPQIETTQIASDFKQKNRNMYFKFKHKFRNKKRGSTYFKTVYVLSTPLKSFVIHEVTKEEQDHENFISEIKL